jgi:hypothetical protein
VSLVALKMSPEAVLPFIINTITGVPTPLIITLSYRPIGSDAMSNCGTAGRGDVRL